MKKIKAIRIIYICLIYSLLPIILAYNVLIADIFKPLIDLMKYTESVLIYGILPSLICAICYGITALTFRLNKKKYDFIHFIINIIIILSWIISRMFSEHFISIRAHEVHYSLWVCLAFLIMNFIVILRKSPVLNVKVSIRKQQEIMKKTKSVTILYKCLIYSLFLIIFIYNMVVIDKLKPIVGVMNHIDSIMIYGILPVFLSSICFVITTITIRFEKRKSDYIHLIINTIILALWLISMLLGKYIILIRAQEIYFSIWIGIVCLFMNTIILAYKPKTNKSVVVLKPYRWFIAPVILLLALVCAYLLRYGTYLPFKDTLEIHCYYNDYYVSLPEAEPFHVEEDGTIWCNGPYGGLLSYKMDIFTRLELFHYFKKTQILKKNEMYINNDVYEINKDTLSEDNPNWEDVKYAEKIIIHIKYNEVEKTIRVARYEQTDNLWAKDFFWYLRLIHLRMQHKNNPPIIH